MNEYLGEGWYRCVDGKRVRADRATLVIAHFTDGSTDICEMYWMPIGTKFEF